MGWLVRPRPCSCGSGRAARDCCGRFKRLSEPDVGRAYLHRQARVARELLAPFSPSGRDGLRHELTLLPAAQPTVQETLRGRGTGEVAKLIVAAAKRPPAEGDALIAAVVARRGFSMTRVALTKAVIARREDGALDEHLTAAAILDLDGPGSVLLAAAFRHAAAELREGAHAGDGADHDRQHATASA